MNILVLTTKLYTTENSGFTRRLYPFLKELKKLGHNITLISYYESDSELNCVKSSCEYYDKIITVKFNRKLSYLRMLRSLYKNVPSKVEFADTLAMRQAVDKEIRYGNYDVLYAHFYKTANFLFKYTNHKRLIDLCDCQYILLDRQLQKEKNFIKRLFLKYEKDKTLKYEKNIIKHFEKCTFISDIDRNFLTGDNKATTAIIPNGVDTDFFKSSKTSYTENQIVYVGSMFSAANHDAIVYFIKNIYPLIKKSIPQITLKIVGAGPRKELLELIKYDKSVTTTGKVDDIRKYLETAELSVAPVRIAAGVQNKILETMSMGIPTITTIEGAQGIISENNPLIIANDTNDFAQQVIYLLKNKHLRQELSLKSREFCIKNYSWNSATHLLENQLFESIKGEHN